MSGPLALVGPHGAGPATGQGDGAQGASAGPPRPRRVPSWAAADPVEELGERLGGQLAAAVHPDEIAAILESEGLTDERITGRYGHPDLFSLAAELFRLVPRRFPEPEPVPDPWQTDVWRCVLRGLTFALPGVAYVLGGRWADGPGGPFGVTRAVAAWGAAALCGWGWNQALAHRAHLLLLGRRPRAAARALLAGAAAGAALATLAAAGVTGLRLPGALAFAAGQSLYVESATVLLVLGLERSLFYVLAPLAVAVACGASALPAAPVAAVLAGTVLAAMATAVATALRTAAAPPAPVAPLGGARPLGSRLRDAARSARDGRFVRPRVRPGARPRRPGSAGGGNPESPATAPDGTPVEAGPGAGHGGSPATALRRARVGAALAAGRLAAHLTGRARALAACARLLRGADEAEGEGGGLPRFVSLPQGLAGLAAGTLVIAAALAGEFVAALTVSMGVAEWLLFRLRSRCLTALRRTAVGERLLARSWRVLAGCLGGYVAVLVGLARVEAAVVPGAAPWDAAHLGVLVALGGALWLTLLLQSCDRPWLGGCVLAAAAVAALALLAARTAAPGAVLGAVCAGAAALQLAAAVTVTGRVTTHR